MTEKKYNELREKLVETEFENIQFANNTVVVDDLQAIYAKLCDLFDENKFEYDLSIEFSDDEKQEKMIAWLEIYNDKKPRTRKILLEVAEILQYINDDTYYITYEEIEDGSYLVVWLNEI